MSTSEFGRAIRLIHSRLKPLPAKSARPVLIVLSGLPGSGKSTVASELGRLVPAVVIASDFVRKTLFPEPTYSGQESRLVHSVSRTVAGHYLKRGYSVVADATNLVEWHRELLARTAERNNAPVLFVQTTAPENIVRSRLRQRFVKRAPDDLSDADERVYDELASQAERIRRPHLRLDTTRDLDLNVKRVLRAIRRAARTAQRSGS